MANRRKRMTAHRLRMIVEAYEVEVLNPICVVLREGIDEQTPLAEQIDDTLYGLRELLMTWHAEIEGGAADGG